MEKKKTILITGASTGIGYETALYFAEKGWNVAATMRSADRIGGLDLYENIIVLVLDVTDPNSIKAAIKETLNRFGNIDVLYNNAGFALAGAFEACSDPEIREQFDANVFGVMNVTREVLPYFRAKNSGIIINTTSSGGLITFPLYSVYNSSKWALEGFMEALQFELKPFRIKIRNIEPANVKSAFTSNITFKSDVVYDDYARIVQRNTLAGYTNAPTGKIVAKVVYRSAVDKGYRLRYPATPGAGFILFLRWLLPLAWFNKLISITLEKPS